MAKKNEPVEHKLETENRTFILLGRVAQGKSSLANLIVGDKKGKNFPTHNPIGSNSVTREVSHCKNHITLKYREEMVINILDQCGFNDPSISLQTHKNNLINCILNDNAKISVNYLVVINLSRPHYEHEQYSMLVAINEWLTNESYTFLDNAVIVFTHKDVLLEEYRIVCEYCYPQELIDKDLLCDDCSEDDEPNLNTIRDCRRCRSTALKEGRLAPRHHEFGLQCQIKCDKCENGTDHPKGPCESCMDNKAYSILNAKRNADEWYHINKALELIPKFIIINTLDMSERVPVLIRLVDLTTPILKNMQDDDANNYELIEKKSSRQINNDEYFVENSAVKMDYIANIRISKANYSTRVVFIHGNSNFPSSLLFKHTRNKINHSTYYTTNYNNKTLKFFFQPDIVSYSEQNYDINHNYVTELPNMDMPLLVSYFILISYNDTYTPAMHKEITNIPNLYDSRLNGMVHVIILTRNNNDIKNIKKNKDLAALINNFAKNRYVTITKNNKGYYEVPEKKKNDLEDTWKVIMSVIMQDDLYSEIENFKKNNLMEAKIPNNYTMDANIQYNYEVVNLNIPAKQIVRSFIIIGDDKNVVTNLLNDGYKEKYDCFGNKQLGIDKSTNDERGFEIISVRGLDNADISVKDWYENLKSAIKDSNPCISHSFLIVFNLSDEYVSYTRVETLNGFINDMNKCETYKFNNKMVIVFTYNGKSLPCTGCNCKTCNKETNSVSLLCNGADNIINGFFEETINCCKKCEEQKLNTTLIEKLNTDKWEQVNGIVNLSKEVILINLASSHYEDKEYYIDRIIEVTKPMIKMIILGNTDFPQSKIREKLKCEVKDDEVEVKHEDFRVWLLFENDFVKYKSIDDQCNNPIYDIVKIVKEDKTNFDGITTIVFLIDLNKDLDHSMRNYIERKIASIDTKEKPGGIWRNVVFLFEAPEGVPEANINSGVIYKSKSLNEFAMKKADNKYVLINEQTTGEDLINKLVQVGINKVFAKNKGKDAINNMLAGMIGKSIDDMNKWSMGEILLIDFESETCPVTNV